MFTTSAASATSLTPSVPIVEPGLSLLDVLEADLQPSLEMVNEAVKASSPGVLVSSQGSSTGPNGLGPTEAEQLGEPACSRTYTYVMRNYSRNGVVLPLRCGTFTWGYNHLVGSGRWSSSFDSMIANAVSRGGKVSGENIYRLVVPTGTHSFTIFRVVYNPGAYNGNDVSPQGIVTAYWEW